MSGCPAPVCSGALQTGAKVLVTQGESSVVLPAREETTLAATAVRIAAGHPETRAGPMFGPLSVEGF